MKAELKLSHEVLSIDIICIYLVRKIHVRLTNPQITHVDLNSELVC